MGNTTFIDDLISKLGSDDASQRCHAAAQLAGLASRARSAAVPLIAACAAEDDARKWALIALQHLGPPDPRDIPVLCRLLGDDSPVVASWAATLLGRLGAPAGESTSALAQALTNGADLHVRQQCAWALGRLGTSAACATQALVEASESQHSRLARMAERSLEKVTGKST